MEKFQHSRWQRLHLSVNCIFCLPPRHTHGLLPAGVSSLIAAPVRPGSGLIESRRGSGEKVVGGPFGGRGVKVGRRGGGSLGNVVGQRSLLMDISI